ncbi:conserved hypothetical protein [Xenorhabdus bovienii str. feltiae Moldova]|uniref:Uncharacterized protein n=1 Tax=Xenorhabdus bovienii str. feltiae Moldova TaxID=1398200 RepID=A0A077NRT2_XENBV|nr:conserved hypothetical protein [Xenorhabdus bovienii str. feltiae Moldova]
MDNKRLGRTLEFIKIIQDKRDNNRSQGIPAGDGPSRRRRKPTTKKSQRSLNGDDMLEAIVELQSRTEEIFGERTVNVMMCRQIMVYQSEVVSITDTLNRFAVIMQPKKQDGTMARLKIKIVTLGYIPARFDIKKVQGLKSKLFEISSIDYHNLNCDSDIGYAWAYSDDLIVQQIPDIGDANFLVVLTNVPLEDNWYSRRLGNNRVIFTFHEIKDYLLYENIPLENVVYRILYSYSLVYMRYEHRIPDYGETLGFTHDETKGCLFDMNGIKSDLIESCNKPIICRECEYKLTNAMVPNNVIENIKHELNNIKKPLYYI